MNGFISNNFQQSNSKFSLICRGILLALALALPLSAWAQTPTHTQSRFAGDEAGDWGGQNLAVVGAPDGTCANMGAVGKVNLIHDFGFDLESVATITGLRFKAKAGAKAGQQIQIRVCENVENLASCSAGFTTGVTAGGTGNCSNTALTDYINVPIGGLGLTEAIVENHLFGLSFEKIETSEVKVDSVCLEVDYTTTFGGSVTSTECFVTPPDVTTLTLNKAVNGGPAANTDWTLSASGPTNITDVTSGTSTDVGIGLYTLSESPGPADYEPATPPVTCAGEPFNGSWSAANPYSLTLAVGDQVACTFANNWIAPETATLTLIKEVINDGGGDAEVGEFLLSYDGDVDFDEGDSPLSGVDIAADTYVLDESGPSGYASSLNCTGEYELFSVDEITLADGDNATCTFTNTYIPPPPPPTEVPTLSQWALILLAMLVLGVGLYSRREHRSRH